MGIDGNEVADELPRPGCSHPLIGSEPVLGTSAKVTRGVITEWRSRKHEEHWQSIRGQRQAKGFIKTLCKKSWGIVQPDQKPVKKIDRTVTGQCHLKGQLLKLGLINSPKCKRCKKPYKMASHVLCECVVFITLTL
jgi:hypothetical protein